MAIIMIRLIQLITTATLRSARHEVVNAVFSKHHLGPLLDGSDCRGYLREGDARQAHVIVPDNRARWKHSAVSL